MVSSPVAAGKLTSSAPTATPFGLPIPWEIKRTSGSRIEPVLDDESANSAVLQRSVVGHQRGLVLDRGTRDHQIKVALLSTAAFAGHALRRIGERPRGPAAASEG